jgi:cellulose biosynthesis protein BcsQ
MVIAYVSKEDRGFYNALKNEYADVKFFINIDEFISFYALSKNRDVVFIYHIENKQQLLTIQNIYFSNNIFIIVVGPSDTELSLLAGKIGVDAYVDAEKENLEEIKRLIEYSKTVVKRRRGKSNIAVFTGISGGIGTTTIAMNTAQALADRHLDKNVLFLDFAHTKAISNIFFEIINPKKTITDIVTIQEFDMEELFKNGLTKVNDNLYIIPGIQKHTDRETLEKAENIQRFLNFINKIKERFDFIIIDVGLFEDVELEIDIQEIADDIFVISEFSIPSMAILKTYIDIIDKSGWYTKTHIVANRSDSFGTISQSEAKNILSKGLAHEFKVDASIPNDARHLRECWNEAKLVYMEYPESPFIKGIQKLIDKYFMEEKTAQTKQNHPTQKKKPSLLEKIKQWL